MARRFGLAALLLAAIAFVGCAATWEQVPEGNPRYSQDISLFYDDLASYGTWVDVEPYGWVWCPYDVPSAWRPYTVGYWIDTDDGWFWFSEDPWGWVPYHYGRWAFDHDYGWVWVPGDAWAPAWVAWRYGPGWIGWAPLPPEVSWQVHVGIVFSSSDLDRHIHHHGWSFMRARDFGAHRVRVRVERPDRNEALLKETRNVTKYAAGPRPVEEGMRPDLIHEMRGKKIERYRIIESSKPASKGGLTIRGRQAVVYRPDADIREMVRERVRGVPPEKRPDPPPQAVERVERKREEPETRVLAVRERVPREQDREMKGRGPGESAVEQRRRQEAELKARKEREEVQKPVVEERERRIAKEREDQARERQNDAQDREESARVRERDAPKGEKAAREREVRERERQVREPGEGKRERDRKPELRQRDEADPDRRGGSRERARGR